jgi:hypothetical protein
MQVKETKQPVKKNQTDFADKNNQLDQITDSVFNAVKLSETCMEKVMAQDRKVMQLQDKFEACMEQTFLAIQKCTSMDAALSLMQIKNIAILEDNKKTILHCDGVTTMVSQKMQLIVQALDFLSEKDKDALVFKQFSDFLKNEFHNVWSSCTQSILGRQNIVILSLSKDIDSLREIINNVRMGHLEFTIKNLEL